MAQDIQSIVARQKDFFYAGNTRPAKYRLGVLNALKQAILANKAEIEQALMQDLNKGEFESYMTEIGIVLDEIKYTMKHLKRWAKPKRVSTPIAHFPARSLIVPQPYGSALVLAPWNYPFQLCMVPLVGALAAGNCAVVKPSAYAPATSTVVAKILGETFYPELVAVVEGGREQNTELLKQDFDYIFFTGSAAVGKVVMAAAAERLVPVTLELGGKSPAIVDETADLKLAARRLAFGKFLNGGQTCIAPDYLLIKPEVKDEFLRLFKQETAAMFLGGDYSTMVKIVNEKHFKRVMGLIEGESVFMGGRGDPAQRIIEPTVLVDVSRDAPVMKEEIFGPVLPVLEYTDLERAMADINAGETPLALYLFSKSADVQNAVFEMVGFGGGCVNDTIIHIANPKLGFGGLGESGMGSYHGKRSFDTFTHYKSVIKKSNALDLKVRYRPYTDTKLKIVKRFMG